MITDFLLAVMGFCFGMLVAGGVFTVLIVVGMLPRFVGTTHSARYEVLYEEFLIFGTIIGCIFSVFKFPYYMGIYLQELPLGIFKFITTIVLVIIGLFSGIFVGCLALSIAEMIDSIPIFTRRIGFRHGLGLTVIAIALGKLCGSLIYFFMNFYGY